MVVRAGGRGGRAPALISSGAARSRRGNSNSAHAIAKIATIAGRAKLIDRRVALEDRLRLVVVEQRVRLEDLGVRPERAEHLEEVHDHEQPRR